MDKPKYVVLDRRQTVAESLMSDGATFGLLLLCIWVSQGSKWWTFCTALMFLFFLYAKVASALSTRQHKFKGIAELQTWAEQQERSNG